MGLPSDNIQSGENRSQSKTQHRVFRLCAGSFFSKCGNRVLVCFRERASGTGISAQTAKRSVNTCQVRLGTIEDTFFRINGIALDGGSKAARLSQLVTRSCSRKCNKLFAPWLNRQPEREPVPFLLKQM